MDRDEAPKRSRKAPETARQAVAGRLAGRVALITGAARGMGRSHAVQLASEGCDIIAVDIAQAPPTQDRRHEGPTPEGLAETAQLAEGSGARVVTAVADVRDLEALRAAVDEGVRRLGRVDIVCANAGIHGYGQAAHDISESDWDDVMGVNLKGAWHTCKAVIPYLLSQQTGGSIVLIGSTAAKTGSPGAAAYSASKHGVVGLMRSLALELAPHSIRVNAIHPTTVNTPMMMNPRVYRRLVPDRENPTLEDAVAAFRRINPLPIPWIEPEDVSKAVLFLASDDSRYVTGIELPVDAGYGVNRGVPAASSFTKTTTETAE